MASCSSAGRRTRRRRRASPGARSDAARRGGAVSRSPPRRGHGWTPHTSKTCSATPWRPSPRSIPHGPQALLPRREGIGDGSIEAASRLDAAAVAFLAYATLRPVLEAWLAPTRPHFADAHWGRGVCPFCGAPPGFVDVIEGGHRRLACHFC